METNYKLLVQMSGPPGSGKSTLANLLARHSHAVVINHDILKSSFLEKGNNFQSSASLAYDSQWSLARDSIKQGRNVIIDSTCNYTETLEQGIALAKQHGYEYVYVECKMSVSDVDILEERLRNRVALRSQRTSIFTEPADANMQRSSSDRNHDPLERYLTWVRSPVRPSSLKDAHLQVTIDSTKRPVDCLHSALQQMGLVADVHPAEGVDTGAIPECPNTAHKKTSCPAILGGSPAFSVSHPIPQILPMGHGHTGDHTAIDSNLRNEPHLDLTGLPYRQRYVAAGSVNATATHRASLQRRIMEFLGLSPQTTSAVCFTTGTNALRAALKVVLNESAPSTRNEVIVTAITAVSTAEAVMMEGYVPVLVDVDPKTWFLSLEATKRAITPTTAAIIVVDWLGTVCDLAPFRKLADEYGIGLVSDSAQSFGALYEGLDCIRPPPSIDMADVTIYSTGFPKVFHTGGSGGILICSPDQAAALEQDPNGILRHEAMPELNAYLGLRALDTLPDDLDGRAKAAGIYRLVLGRIPGIEFQYLNSGSATNHYQLSITVDPHRFGMNADMLSRALEAENIHSTTTRMRCLGDMPKLLRCCRVAEEGLPVSRLLSQTSLTLPIYSHISPETCLKICSCINAIHHQATSIAQAAINSNVETLSLTPSPANLINIEAKFHND